MTRLIPVGHSSLVARRVGLWLADPATRRQLLDPQGIVRSAEGRGDPNERHFAVLSRYGATAGYLRIAHRNWPIPTAAFDLIIGPRFRRRGLARSTLKGLPDLTDNLFDTRIIVLGAFDDNLPALRLYRSLGYGDVERTTFTTSEGERAAFILSNHPELLTASRSIGFQTRAS